MCGNCAPPAPVPTKVINGAACPQPQQELATGNWNLATDSATYIACNPVTQAEGDFCKETWT